MNEAKTVGIVFGCFIPLHDGHMAMIDRARLENDGTIIGVTGHDMDRGRDFVPFLRRVRLMHQVYDGQPDVTMAEVDDRAIGLTGTFSERAWRTWCAELFRSAGQDPDDRNTRYTWYSGDEDYLRKIRNVFPRHSYVQLDRSVNAISGTVIRQDPVAYRDRVHPVFYKYLKAHGQVKEEPT